MYIVVLITAKDFTEAEKVARSLLENKVAACINISQDIRSLFWWEGKVDESREVLMIVKSKKKHFKKLMSLVKSLHSYMVPEIIALPIINGSKDYLNWLNESTP